MIRVSSFIMDHLYILVLFPIVMGSIMFILPKKVYKAYMLSVQAIMLFMASLLFMQLWEGNALNHVIRLGSNDIHSFYGIYMKLDSLSVIMVLTTVIIFTLCVGYNLQKTYTNKNFLFLFYTLQGLICGVFMAGDLFNIFVLMEVSTLIVSILIMYKKDSRSMYDGMMYLLTNIVAMTFFLFGVVLLYERFHVIYIVNPFLDPMTAEVIVDSPFAILKDNPSIAYLPLAFIYTGICLKAAIMPLFSWLPKAHGTPGAPSVVSAILSSVYVTIGIYLFIVISRLFSEYINVYPFFMIAGIITAILGIVFALTQKDIKLILAYSTVSQLGLVLFAFSANAANDIATVGAQYHLVIHAIAKCTLFLIAGMIVDRYETREMSKIRGVFKSMPFVSMAALLSIFGLIGMPYFGGWYSKAMMATELDMPLYYIFMAINAGTIMIFAKFSLIFFGGVPKTLKKFNEPVIRRIIVVFGALSSLALGIFAKSITENIFQVNTSGYFTAELGFGKFAILAVLSYLAYHFIIAKIRSFDKLSPPDLGFNSVAISIILFFVLILGYMTIFV